MLHLIPLFPFVGFLINATLGRRLSKTVSGSIATAAMGFAFGYSVLLVYRLVHMTPVVTVVFVVFVLATRLLFGRSSGRRRQLLHRGHRAAVRFQRGGGIL